LETGTKISLGVHGALIGLAAFGGPLFDADESKAIQISEVSIISAEVFDGMMSSAPNPNLEEPQQSELVKPVPLVDVPLVMETLEQTVEELLEPKVQVVAEAETVPELETEPADPVVLDAQEVPIDQEKTGDELASIDALVSSQDQSGLVDTDSLALSRPKPRPALRVSNEVVEKPTLDVELSEVETQKTEASDEPALEKPENIMDKAKPESTTQIVTEAEEIEPNIIAPTKSARPRGRPADVLQKALASKKVEKARSDELVADATAQKMVDEDERKKAEVEAIEKALKAVQEEPVKPSGPPLTGREKGALVLAVQKCWAPPIGVQNASDLKVTLLVKLNAQGKITGKPTLVSPSGSPQGVVKQAYEAGRRALLRCAPYDLPKDKYEQWRDIEVTFNPQKMVVR